MRTYSTSEAASIIGIHPNTVRFYEKWGLITEPERQRNGYRIFTDLHIQQMRLVRVAFQIEVLQNGLRKKTVEVVKAAAECDFDRALSVARQYAEMIRKERSNAEEAIAIAGEILSGSTPCGRTIMKRAAAAEHLGVTVDTLRNWENNGLLEKTKKVKGCRVYTWEDIQRLKIIRTLRCANYSLESILRMLRKMSQNPDADLKEALNTPEKNDDVISVCDKLMDSLDEAEQNAGIMIGMIYEMKDRW